MTEPEDLIKATKIRFDKYDEIKKKGLNLSPGEFWDVVVLTAVDKEQKDGYDANIKDKLESGDLSSYPEYVVVSDPPGSKIGNGGSTLVVIETLFNKFGESFWKKKVIVIHAGGYSQRMPNASIIGKAFISFPIVGKVYTAMDIKLATYIDFPEKIEGGGMFVCCPDTFEVYSDNDMQWGFPDEGFTGLAHLSPLNIAKDHGVYVLDESAQKDDASMIKNCVQFLHKPTLDQMRSTENCIQTDQTWKCEKAFTDSAFFISSSALKLLLDFYRSHSPLDCEIDAYGDFLQALGSKCDSKYVYNTSNVVCENNNLVQTRKDLFDVISSQPLHAVIMDDQLNNVSSKFYHLGTTHEYIHHFTSDNQFQNILQVQPLTSCDGSYAVSYSKSSTEICIFNSHLNSSKIGKCSVISNCIIHTDTAIGHHCILDSCEIYPSFCIPDETFMLTTAFYPNFTERKYVAIIFGINDNTKKTVHRDCVKDLQYFGIPLHSLFNIEDILPKGDDYVSLWNLKLFPISDSQKTANTTASKALQQISNPNNFNKLYQGQQLCSMSYILKYKRM